MAYRPSENVRMKHSFSPTSPSPQLVERFDPTPVRRTYLEKSNPHNNSSSGSFHNQSSSVMMMKSAMHSQSLQSAGGSLPPPAPPPPVQRVGQPSSVPGAPTEGGITPLPHIVELPRSKTHLGFISGLPKGPGKNAPARVRALEGVRRPNSVAGTDSTATTGGGVGGRTTPSWLGEATAHFAEDMMNLSAPTPDSNNNINDDAMMMQSQQLIRSESVLESLPPETLKVEEDPTTRPIHVPYAPDLRARPKQSSLLHTHAAPTRMVLKDYQMLAEACQRAGKARMEGHAYYKMGEMQATNPDTRPKAILNFTKYLNICRRLNDLQGEAKALNCLGILHHEMGGLENLTKAIEFHRQHSEVADAAGVFISHTNMGLIHAELGDNSKAIDAHKIALQYAVRAGDKQAESLALSHLGRVERKHGDLATAKVCLDRHVELATTLHDPKAVCSAQTELGVLALDRKDYTAAAECFAQALEVALQSGDQQKAQELRCQLGFARGMEGVTQHVSEVSENMGAKIRK